MDTRSLEALKALESAQPSNKFGTRLHDLPTQALEEEASMCVKVTGNQFKDAFCMPMKRREIWIVRMSENLYANGTYAPMPENLCAECWRQLGARVLATNAGRLEILHCIKAGVGLRGDPREPDVRGINDK